MRFSLPRPTSAGLSEKPKKKRKKKKKAEEEEGQSVMPPRPPVRSEIEECREIAAAIQPLCRRGRGAGSSRAGRKSFM